MRKGLAVLIAGLTLAAGAWAQSAETQAQGYEKHGRGGARIFQRLNLSEDQKAKVQSIFQNERTQAQAIKGNASLTDEQKKQQLRQLRETNHQQLFAVLTPEQQAQLKQMREEHGGHRGGFKRGGGFQALNLTEQQKSQLKPIFESTRQQMQALRSDTSLTPEQKREKMQQIRQNQMAQVKAILTPEQQQQLQNQRGHRWHKGGQQQQTPPSA